MPQPLPTQEFNLSAGQSLCLVFDHETDLRASVYAFLRKGVAQDHRAIYLISETRDLSMLDYLRPGPGSGGSTSRLGQLRIQRAGDVFLALGLDGTKFANWVRDEEQHARQAGFTGLNLVVEMGWAAGKPTPAELLAFETNLTQGLAGSTALALTLYNRQRFQPQHLMQVLTAHPLVIHLGVLKTNPFYIPLQPDLASESLQRWLDRLQIPAASHNHTPESDERLRLMVASMPVVIFALNLQGVFTLSEGKGLDALGVQPGEVVGLRAHEVFPEVAEVEVMLHRTRLGETFSIDVTVNDRLFETHCAPLRTQSGEIDGVLGVAVDITERRQAEVDLRASEERYRLLVENQGEGTGIFSPEGQVLYVNAAAEGILGLPVEQIVGRSILEFIPADQRAVFAREMATRKTGLPSTYEMALMRSDGQRRQVLITATPRYDASGAYLGSFAIFRDITDRKRMEDRLRFQSHHDALTGLYNRHYFDESLEVLNRNRRHPVSIIMIDVDNMKETNDQLGHRTGDELLRRVAHLLRSTFRSQDVVARIGGDEFAILLPESDQKVLDRLVERLRHNLQAMNQTQEYPHLKISIGGASAEVDQSLTKTFDLADQRMYREKYARKKKGA